MIEWFAIRAAGQADDIRACVRSLVYSVGQVYFMSEELGLCSDERDDGSLSLSTLRGCPNMSTDCVSVQQEDLHARGLGYHLLNVRLNSFKHVHGDKSSSRPSGRST